MKADINTICRKHIKRYGIGTFSRMVGVSRVTIWRYLKGRNGITLRTAERILRLK